MVRLTKFLLFRYFSAGKCPQAWYPREGSDANGYLESWDFNNLFASAFRNSSGNRIVLLSQKRTHRLGFAERGIDSLQTSPFKILSTIIRRKEQSYQESATHGKITLAISHRCTLITSTSERGVARTSTRCMGHQAPGCEPLRKLLLSLIEKFQLQSPHTIQETPKKKTCE